MITRKQFNLNNIISPFTKVVFLYLYGVLLYVAVVAVVTYSSPSDVNETMMGGKIRLYWGVLFGPVFMLFTVSSTIGVLMGILRGILRKGIKDMSILESALFLWLVADAAALIVGMVKGNSIRYILSDTFILAIPPLSYFFVKDHIEDMKDVRRFFYLILFAHLIVILFPYTWLLPPPKMALTSGGLYVFCGTEAFITASLMVFAVFSERRWLFLGLLVVGITASLFMLGIMYILQILVAAILIIFIHYSNKGFVKRFAGVWLVIFFSLFILSRVALFQPILTKIVRVQDIVHTLFLKASNIYSSVVKETAKVKVAEIRTNEVKVSEQAKSDVIEKGENKAAEKVDKIFYTHRKWWVGGNMDYSVESTVKNAGKSGIKISGVGTLYQRISHYYKMYHFADRSLTFGVWLYSTVPENISISLTDSDGITSDHASSVSHPGNGRWEFLTVSKVIRKKSHVVELRISEHKGNTSSYIDGAVVVEGEVSGDELKSLVTPENDMFEDFEVGVIRDESMNQRTYEAEVVLDNFRNKLLALPLGFGNGATIDLSESTDITMRSVYGDKITKVHFIHLLPFAILYRQGLLGISMFIFLSLAIIVSFIKMRRYFKTLDEHAIITEIFFLNVFMMLAAGILASAHFFIDITVGFGLGMIGVALVKQNNAGNDSVIKTEDER